MGTYIIAEAGVNHNGSFELACKLVDAAKSAGADCIKFQTFKSGNLVSHNAQKAEYQKDTTGEGSQVEMLKKLYYNQFGFSSENIKAVKDSICLYSADDGTLSGKTGTEEVSGHNTSGWFIGYVEKDSHTYFFATNIQNEKLASGPLAAELTFSILSDLELWNAYQE